jgi:hypothetical protein
MIHGPVMRFSGQMLVTLIGQLYLVSMNTVVAISGLTNSSLLYKFIW